jgi:hypothetical protein
MSGFSEDSKLELVALSIATRFKYDHGPPLTPQAVLATLFQGKFPLALLLVLIDSESTVVENYIATRVLCHKFRVSETEMQGCLRTIGSNCCRIFAGVMVISGICLRHKVKIYVDNPGNQKLSTQYTRFRRTFTTNQPEQSVDAIL